MKKANVSFKSKNDLDSIEIDKSRINTFISLEEDKSIGLRPDKWNKKKPKELKVLQQFEDKLSRKVNYIVDTTSVNRTLSLSEKFFTKNIIEEKKELIRSETTSTILDLGKEKEDNEKNEKLITKVFVKKSEIKDKKPKKNIRFKENNGIY